MYQPEMNYRQLTAGEVRQEGDEVRSKYKVDPSSCPHPSDRVATWRPSTLLGHTILQSDLVQTELRRPLL